MRRQIGSIVKSINTRAKGCATGFVIGNTSGVFGCGRFYPMPLREVNTLMYGGVIVRDVKTAVEIARLVDGKVDYLILDSEKKIEKIYYGKNDVGNMERHVREEISKSKILTYKGNDLAVEAIDFLLSQFIGDIGARQIAIIGFGNIGAKIALKLVERGAYIRAYRRDRKKLKKIVEGLNLVKSEHTISPITVSHSIEAACKGASIVIASADSRGVITEKHLRGLEQSIAPILIDVGKGCFADSVVRKGDYSIYRIDVSMVQKHLFAALLETNRHYSGKTLGRRTIREHGLKLVSLGLLGKRGEIVVDDIEKPTTIIGVADGKGSLIKHTGKYAKALKKLRSLYSIR